VSILRTLTGPADLRGLTEDQLVELAAEIRQTILSTVARTGGHLGSSLGVVELTIALHRLLDSPRDKIVWDTGHQAYPHKLLTGRLERFGTLRQIDGVGGFPRRSESPHDVFDGGHAGTGLSIAEGLATARDLRHSLERVAVVVGDAALLSGLSLEALNDIGHRQSQLLIVLNDNEMSISPSVGALSKYLSDIKLSTAWQQSKSAYDRITERIPVVGPRVLEMSRRLRQSVVSFVQPGQLFEDLGITYIGVMPGHDLRLLEETFRRALALPGPVIVHVRTQKGKGYRPAEKDQISFHGAALPESTALVDVLEYTRVSYPQADPSADPSPAKPQYQRRFVAFVVRRDRPIACVDLGPAKPIDAAIGLWRGSRMQHPLLPYSGMTRMPTPTIAPMRLR
jgi:1-deoxy-D-xylulose-5-phosphate synthase